MLGWGQLRLNLMLTPMWILKVPQSFFDNFIFDFGYYEFTSMKIREMMSPPFHEAGRPIIHFSVNKLKGRHLQLLE
jgi:hypothetical protein